MPMPSAGCSDPGVFGDKRRDEFKRRHYRGVAAIVWHWECCNDSFLPASRGKLGLARGIEGSNPALSAIKYY
jgi:hypothetical protein